MMQFENRKPLVHLPEGDTDFFDVVAGVLQGDVLTPNLFLIFLDQEFRMSIDLMKENSFTWKKKKKTNKKARSRRYPTEDM